MKLIIRSFLIVLALYGTAFAQTAAILPNAVSQYFDNNGNPLSSGTVTTYVVGTSTLKTTWRDAAETIPNTNPVILDAGGKAIIYGDGNYRQVVKDRNGNTIWDAVTSAFGSGGATLLGDGNNVGTILSWSGIVAPTHYVFTYGQELSRVTYATLYGTLTLNANANCTSASNILTGLSDTTQIPIGAPVEASCVAPGTTVTTKAASSVTMSNNASVTVSTTARFFPWGNGNGTTTFNVPDLRGKVLPGRDNMGGTAAATLTSTYYGVNPDALGASGGAQSKALATTNLPAYTPAGAIVSTQVAHDHFVANTDGLAAVAALTAANKLAFQVVNAATSTNYTLSGTGTAATIGLTSQATPVITSTFTGTAQGGAATAFSLIQPSITMNYVIKVLPDTSISTLAVVTSLGGMSGDITCSAPLICSAQNIGAGGLGSGDVIGPSSSLDGSIVLFNGGTGKIIKDSVGIIPNLTTFTNITTAFTAINAGLEIGNLASSGVGYVDFHSSGFANDYDVRLISTGGISANPGRGTLTLQGTLAIATAPGSLDSAIGSTQSLAGTTGPLALNQFLINGDVANAGASFVDGWVFQHNFGGGAFRGGREALKGIANLTTATVGPNANSNYVGVVGIANAQASSGGTSSTVFANTNGAVFGLNGNGVAQSGATNLTNVAGAEFDVAVQTGASVWAKTVAQFAGRSDDGVSGTVIDTMMWFINQTALTPGFTNWVLIDDLQSFGGFPIKTTGTLFKAGSTFATYTIANGFDTHLLTITGNAWQSPGATISGVGAGSFTGLTTGNVVITGGTLIDTANALSLTATQPTTITGTQDAVSLTITSAGSSSQINRAASIAYNAGYTGSSTTVGLAVNNAVAGTGSTIIPASGSITVIGNIGINNLASATTTGSNIGSSARAQGGDINVGSLGVAQVAKTGAGNKINIGGAFSAYNTVTGGSTAIQIGLWASLNQTTAPTTSAAFIADNGAQSASIALFQAAGSTVASFDATGNLTTPTAKLSATSNQLVFQSAGVTGTMSWAPSSTNKTLTWPNGTTDFTATGGTSQVVKQTSAGAAFTVARLACADLSDAAATCSSASGESLVIGTTAITSGTNTRILYDNSGVLGEYTITGTGTVVAMQAGPTFTGTLTNAGIATNGTDTITSASAVALTVGLNGATNPAFAIDASTSSQAAGFKITGAATGGTVALVTIDSGSNTNVTFNAKGSGTIGIGSVSTGAVTITPALTLSAALTYGGVTLVNSVTGTGSMALSIAPTFTGTLTNAGIATNGTDTVTSASATALTVGRLGATTPALQIDASTATSITGVKIKSAATGGGVAISAIGETNVNTTIDANGSGTLVLQGTATGAITLTRATTLSAALTYGGVTLSNAVTGTGNMALSASPTFTGTVNAAAITASGIVSAVSLSLSGTTVIQTVGNFLQINSYDGTTRWFVGKTGVESYLRGTQGLYVQNDAGSTTYTSILSTGLTVATGQLNVTSMTQTAVAQSGTVCYNNGTGAVTYDATVGCLASFGAAKNIRRELTDQECISIVTKLRVIEFTRKAGFGGESDADVQIGFEAEQVDSIDERLTARRGDGSLAGVRYAQNSAIYACAVRALKSDNDNLRHNNNNLELRLQALEARMKK